MARSSPTDHAKGATGRVGLGQRLALSPDEAAHALGVSRDYFDLHVMPELRVVRRGRRRLVPLKELERWLDESAAHALDRDRADRAPAHNGRGRSRTRSGNGNANAQREGR